MSGEPCQHWKYSLPERRGEWFRPWIRSPRLYIWFLLLSAFRDASTPRSVWLKKLDCLPRPLRFLRSELAANITKKINFTVWPSVKTTKRRKKRHQTWRCRALPHRSLHETLFLIIIPAEFLYWLSLICTETNTYSVKFPSNCASCANTYIRWDET